ncbi:MAG: thioredoxin family protein [Planctomycetaceae bacterium]
MNHESKIALSAVATVFAVLAFLVSLPEKRNRSADPPERRVEVAERVEPAEAPKPEPRPTSDPFHAVRSCGNPRCCCDPCRCGTDCVCGSIEFLPPSDPENAAPSSALVVITAEWCVPCLAVHAAAAGLPGVIVLDLDHDRAEIHQLCEGRDPPAVPAYVRTVDGQPVRRWTGATDRAGLIRMRDGEAP